MSKTFEKIFLIASFASILIAFNAHPILGDWIYYKGISFGMMLSFWLIYSLTKQRKEVVFWSKTIAFLATNNFIDELFFNPTAFQVNDYLVAVIIIIWQWRIRKRN